MPWLTLEVIRKIEPAFKSEGRDFMPPRVFGLSTKSLM